MKDRISLWLSIVGIVGALCFVLWPLLRPGFYVSDDGEWMVIRLSAFYQSLSGGQFPVRFLGRLNNSYGYPVANFLYPGFLYIGSVLHLLGLSLVSAVKGILGTAVIGGTLALFATLRTRFRMIPSLLGTLSFVFSPYLLFDVYRRGSVGEVLAIAAFALALFSLTRKLPWLFAPSIGLLIVSHNTVALIAMLALLPLLLLTKDRYRMLLAALIGVGASAFFWLPALVEKRFVRFDAVAVSNPLEYFIRMEHAQLLGLTTIIALALLIGWRVKRTLYERVMIGIVVAGFVFSLPVSFPVWRLPQLGALVQFPYRFLVLPTVLGPWIVACVAEQLKGWKLLLLSSVFVFVWLMGATTQLREVEFNDRALGYYMTNEGTTNVADEYMPRWVKDVSKSRPVETLEVIDGDVTLSTRTFTGEHMVVQAEAKVPSIVQINKIYYPGWGITIDNTLVPIDYQNATGVMRVTIPQGKHTLVAAFRETPLRFAADMVSVLSVICYAVMIRRLSKTI
jgi:hypothetical protein